MRTGAMLAVIAPFFLKQASGQVMSQGPFNPGAVTYEFVGCLGCPGAEWLNPQLAMLPDSQFASTPLQAYPNCFQSACYHARGMLASGFGFSIPPNATVTGITVDILRKAYTSGTIRDSAVALIKNGQNAGAPKVGPDPWPLMAQYKTYGDTADVWGTTWTPADLNSAQFGVYLKPMNKSGGFDSAAVDQIRVTAHYTVPVSVPLLAGHELSFYYDPGTRELVLQSAGKEGIVRVYDSAGRLAWAGSCDGVCRPTLAPGLYVATLLNGPSIRFVMAE